MPRTETIQEDGTIHIVVTNQNGKVTQEIIQKVTPNKDGGQTLEETFPKNGATHTVVYNSKNEAVQDIWRNPKEHHDACIIDPSVDYGLKNIETKAVHKEDPDFATQPHLFS